MPFKLVHSNKNGTFSVDLPRAVSANELASLCQLAINIVPEEEEEIVTPSTPVYGPDLPQQSSPNSSSNTPFKPSQLKLGEKPVDKISLGEHIEPPDGFRIKIVSLINTPIVPLIKFMRDVTKISAVGCKEIIYGNILCPILHLEQATKIVGAFKEAGVYARIVPAFDN